MASGNPRLVIPRVAPAAMPTVHPWVRHPIAIAYEHAALAPALPDQAAGGQASNPVLTSAPDPTLPGLEAADLVAILRNAGVQPTARAGGGPVGGGGAVGGGMGGGAAKAGWGGSWNELIAPEPSSGPSAGWGPGPPDPRQAPQAGVGADLLPPQLRELLGHLGQK